MSDRKNVKISFRDSASIVDSLDEMADLKGIDRSSVLRMMIREKFAADSADPK